jgi:hypothetical protein
VIPEVQEHTMHLSSIEAVLKIYEKNNDKEKYDILKSINELEKKLKNK